MSKKQKQDEMIFATGAKVTPGMANAYSRLSGSGRRCSSCGFELPKYPGAYPKHCPNCGELLLLLEPQPYIAQEGKIDRLLDLTSQAIREDVTGSLEKFAGFKLKPGRNVIKGYPVDVDDDVGSDGC